MKLKKKKIIKKYLPEFEPKMVFKNSLIKLFNSSSTQSLDLKGSVKVKDHFNDFKINEIYDYSQKSFDINGTIDLTNSKVEVPRIN